MKKIIFLFSTHNLDVVELTFTGSRSRSCLKIKLTFKKNHKFKVKNERTERESNPEWTALKSSTLTITPQKTAHLLTITHLTIARLRSKNVNKVKNIIKFIIINFLYQPTQFSMSKSFSNI